MVGKRPAVVLLAVGASTLATLAAVPAYATTTIRYASPNPLSSACTKTSPCSITQALSAPPADTKVLLEPGSYGTAAAPLPTALTVGAGITDIGGTPGGLPVAIYSSASQTALTVASGKLHDVTVVTSGATAIATEAPGLATRVTGLSTAASGVGCDVGAGVEALTDSVCLASGTTGVAVQTVLVAHTTLAPVTAAVRNVTAEATGTGGIGLRASVDETPGGSAQLTLDVTNDIIRGTTTDIDAVATGGATETVFVRHSDFRPDRSIGGSLIDTDTTNLSAAPVFVNPAAGNYREKASSPTIDKGASRPAGDRDRAGNPRSLGAAPDIGAYEFLLKPTISTVKITKRGKHFIDGYVKGSGRGLSTRVTILLKRHGKVVLRVKARQPIVNRFRVAFSLGQLHKHRTYRLQAVATNKAGTTNSATKRVTTRR